MSLHPGTSMVSKVYIERREWIDSDCVTPQTWPEECGLPRLPSPAEVTAMCPIRATLDVLGRKWSLLILRDVAFFPGVRWGQFLRNIEGLTPRMLSMRLSELQEEGFIERVADGDGGQAKGYQLTPKGADAVPILTAFIHFGIRHHADHVFADGKPRTLSQVFPGPRPELLGSLGKYARSGRDGPES